MELAFQGFLADDNQAVALWIYMRHRVPVLR
jgi:hypothetical protein